LADVSRMCAFQDRAQFLIHALSAPRAAITIPSLITRS
jgi:hypothetical protein